MQHDHVDAFKDIAALDGRAVIHYARSARQRQFRCGCRTRGWISGLSTCSSMNPGTVLRKASIEKRACLPRQSAACSAPSTWWCAGSSWPQGAGDRHLACQHAHLGGGGHRLCHELPWWTCRMVADTPRGGRHDHRSRIHRRSSCVFYDRHVCRVVPCRQEVARNLRHHGRGQIRSTAT